MVEGRGLAADVRRSGVLRQSRPAKSRQYDQQGPPLQRRRKRGAEAQAIGTSRGGRTTKTHAVVDAGGRLIAFDLTAGQKADVRAAEPLLTRLPVAAQLLADTAYDSDAFRGFLNDRGSVPVIRPHPRRKDVPPFDADLYKARNVVERAFSRLKDWRRMATRYDKLARNFQATVSLAAILIWWAN